MTTPDIQTRLNPEQIARASALGIARELLRSTPGPMRSAAPDLEDLINLAHFILTGLVDPGVFLPETTVRAERPFVDSEDDPWWWDLTTLAVHDSDAIHIMVRTPGQDFWAHTHDCLPNGNDARVHCDQDLSLSPVAMKAWLDNPTVHAEEYTSPTQREANDD